MVVKKIITETRMGNKNTPNEIENPKIEKIESEIKMLDGKTKTLLSLKVNENSSMYIGGGPNLYFVTIYHNDKNYNLLNISEDKSIIKLKVGGQITEYEKEECVDIEYAIKAARYYSIHGDIDKSCKWEITD